MSSANAPFMGVTRRPRRAKGTRSFLDVLLLRFLFRSAARDEHDVGRLLSGDGSCRPLMISCIARDLLPAPGAAVGHLVVSTAGVAFRSRRRPAIDLSGARLVPRSDEENPRRRGQFTPLDVWFGGRLVTLSVPTVDAQTALCALELVGAGQPVSRSDQNDARGALPDVLRFRPQPLNVAASAAMILGVVRLAGADPLFLPLLLFVVFCSVRFALIAADVRRDGLQFRNLLSSHAYRWAQIVEVRASARHVSVVLDSGRVVIIERLSCRLVHRVRPGHRTLDSARQVNEFRRRAADDRR